MFNFKTIILQLFIIGSINCSLYCLYFMEWSFSEAYSIEGGGIVLFKVNSELPFKKLGESSLWSSFKLAVNHGRNLGGQNRICNVSQSVCQQLSKTFCGQFTLSHQVTHCLRLKQWIKNWDQNCLQLPIVAFHETDILKIAVIKDSIAMLFILGIV